MANRYVAKNTPQSERYVNPDTGKESRFTRSYLKRQGFIFYDTPYKDRDLTTSEQRIFDLYMRATDTRTGKKMSEREGYAENLKKSIIRPVYQRDRRYQQNLINQLDAGSDMRTASKQANTALRAEVVQEQLEQQARMKAIAKASKSNFGAAAMTAGMTGAGTLAGASTVGGAASAGTSLITPDIKKSVTTPKISASDQAMSQAAKERSEQAKAAIASEIKTQETLAPIRQRRRRAAEQQASLLRRRTGRRALLSSPAGGAGFFGGYFKG